MSELNTRNILLLAVRNLQASIDNHENLGNLAEILDPDLLNLNHLDDLAESINAGEINLFGHDRLDAELAIWQHSQANKNDDSNSEPEWFGPKSYLKDQEWVSPKDLAEQQMLGRIHRPVRGVSIPEEIESEKHAEKNSYQIFASINGGDIKVYDMDASTAQIAINLLTDNIQHAKANGSSNVVDIKIHNIMMVGPRGDVVDCPEWEDELMHESDYSVYLADEIGMRR